MVVFQDILKRCKAVIPTNVQFDGVLSLTVLGSDDEIEWRSVVHSTKGEDFKYYKITRLKLGKTVVEESNLPFGYSPFDTINVELDQAIQLAQKENANVGKIYKLYFPLSPFDTEPLWFFTTNDGLMITIGANTKELKKEKIK